MPKTKRLLAQLLDRVMMGLFERIFRQPLQSDVNGEENLATELVAFFLDHSRSFRAIFLDAIDIVDTGGTWEVKTQFTFDGQGETWSRKRPDIVMWKHDPAYEKRSMFVIIEVKLDAPTTFDGIGNAQTKHYLRDYLEDARTTGRIGDYRLASLTKWRPDNALGCKEAIRFTQVAKWLSETSVVGADGWIGELGQEWSKFLREKNWAMPKLESQDVEGLLKIRKELGLWLQDVVTMAIDEASTTTAWESTCGCSTPLKGRLKYYFVAPPLIYHSTTSPTVELGFYYFDRDDGEPRIHGMVKGGHIITEDQMADGWAYDIWHGNRVLLLKNIVPKIGKVDDDDIWVEMRKEFAEALAKLAPG